ncbi:hypothetical protein DAHU10_037740 [Hanseniaspora uvarum]|nr:hypothetical protein DAHU10_037740 [Hanseniaspora uvarum]
MYKTLKAKSSSSSMSQNNILFSNGSTRKLTRSVFSNYNNTLSFKLNSSNSSTYLKLFKRNVQTTAKKDTLNYILQDKNSQRHRKVKEELSKQTVKSLRNQLRTYKLKVSGNKSELIERLTNYSLNEQGDMTKDANSQQAKLFKESIRTLSEPKKLHKFNDNVRKVVSEKPKVKINVSKHNTELSLTKERINKEKKSVDIAVKSSIIKAPTTSIGSQKKDIKTESLQEETNFVKAKSFKPAVMPIKAESKSALTKPDTPLYEDIRFEDLPDYTISSKEKVMLLSAVVLSFLWITFGINTL